MNASSTQMPCNHEVSFPASLDHAPACKWCGAIVRISPRAVLAQASIEWVLPDDDGKSGSASARSSR